jgi:hypothetical protein
VKIPPNLLVKCDDIPEIGKSDKGQNLGEVVKYTTELMKQYNECAIRHDQLIEAAKPKQTKE